MNIAKELKLPHDETGNYYLPSSWKNADGKPRFILPLLNDHLEKDAGVRFLATHETLYSGYEYASRQFFNMHLNPGDVFIDVGAHWGIFSLSAATTWPGDIHVIAIEPYPLNVMQLTAAIKVNRLEKHIEVIAAAAAAENGLKQLKFNSSMGHHLRDITGKTQEVNLHVPTLTLDSILAERPELKKRRIFLKIDVEGLEPEVIQGAEQLLGSGQVAAIVWEKGRDYRTPVAKQRLLKMLDQLASYGYEQFRFPQEYGGVLLPFAPTYETGNVFCLHNSFVRQTNYPRPFSSFPPYSEILGAPNDPHLRSETTELLAKIKSSDATRWCNPQELTAGAEQRAAFAASAINPGESVLDLGAGALALKKALPENCNYFPADLICRSENCQVVDLNQGQFPLGHYDVITLLDVLEYIHDIPPLLQQCRTAAQRLIISYHCVNDSDSSPTARFMQGWFSDLSKKQLTTALKNAGWSKIQHTHTDDLDYFVCE